MRWYASRDYQIRTHNGSAQVQEFLWWPLCLPVGVQGDKQWRWLEWAQYQADVILVGGIKTPITSKLTPRYWID